MRLVPSAKIPIIKIVLVDVDRHDIYPSLDRYRHFIAFANAVTVTYV